MPGHASPASGIVKLGSARVRTHGARSLWLTDVLGGRQARDGKPFKGDATTDVCIIGGGFTGMWTALELKARFPGTDVTLVEADICGAGASGRNGGFALTWWAHFDQLVALCGPLAAQDLARRAQQAVVRIGDFCAQRGIGDAFRMGGWVWAATNPAQVGSWKRTVARLDELGVNPYRELSHRELVDLTGSAQHLAGLFEPTSAAVQPARIARELCAAIREAGVNVYEHSQVYAIEPGPRAKVVLKHGTIAADQVVLATNAWAARIPEIGAGLVVVASDVIATRAAPERLADAGVRPGVCISDGRRLVNYYHASSEGRMVFGKGGGTLAYGNRITRNFDHPGRRAAAIRSQLVRTYPGLWDVPIESRWSGPIDYSLSGLPFFVRLRDAPSVLVCAGFSGDGVGPSRLAGEILATMVAGAGDTDAVPAAMRRVPTGLMPPEPIRYLGGRMVRAAVARKERSEDLAVRPRTIDRMIAALDPTGHG